MEGQENKQEFIKTKPVLPLLVSMAVPMMFSMLIQSLYNIVDSIFVSRLGTEALTAVSLVYPMQNLLVAVGVGTGVGMNAAIATNLGAKRFEDANKTASTGAFLALIHAACFVLIGIFGTRPFLLMFTEDAQVLDMACRYGYIVMCASVGYLLQMYMEKIFQAIGDMMTAMLLLGVSCITNIILDPILIFGYFGLPAMGVSGAALATVIGQSFGFLLYAVIYKKKKISVRISRKYIHLCKEIIRPIYSVGVPSGLMIAMPSLLVSILNGMLIRYSEIYVAVLGVYFKLQTFIYMPANGIIQGMRTIVSYNYGAGEKKRVNQAVRFSLILAAAIMAAGTAAALIFPGQILSLFDADGELIKRGILALRIISLGFIVSSAGVVYCGAFEALGQGLKSLIVSVIRQLLILLPAWVLSCLFGVTGIWIAFPVSELLAAVVAWILYRKGMRE